jgi:hypothetical protein
MRLSCPILVIFPTAAVHRVGLRVLVRNGQADRNLFNDRCKVSIYDMKDQFTAPNLR